MRRPALSVLVGAGLAGAVASAALSGSVLRPPAAFQGDNWAVVTFLDVAEVDAACRAIGAEGRGRIDGCARGRAVILPNPCRLQGFFADVTCHELAHVNGWSHEVYRRR